MRKFSYVCKLITKVRIQSMRRYGRMVIEKVNKNDPWAQFHGPNLGYVIEQYEQYVDGADSIDPELKELIVRLSSTLSYEKNLCENHIDTSSPILNDVNKMEKAVKVGKLLDDIRSYGHLAANIIPLEEKLNNHSLLNLEKYGLNDHDLKAIPAKVVFEQAPDEIQTAFDAINWLKDIYTSSLAYEFDKWRSLRFLKVNTNLKQPPSGNPRNA